MSSITKPDTENPVTQPETPEKPVDNTSSGTISDTIAVGGPSKSELPSWIYGVSAAGGVAVIAGMVITGHFIAKKTRENQAKEDVKQNHRNEFDNLTPREILFAEPEKEKKE